MKIQGRFRHLFAPQYRPVIESLQAEVDQRWQELLRLEEMTGGGQDAAQQKAAETK